MKLKLYTIQQEYIALAESIIDSDGEVTPEQETALQINKEQLETKGQCYGFIIKDLENDIGVIDGEIKRLSVLKSSRNKTIERLKDTLTNAMNLYEIEKIETPTLKISFRKSESIEVENVDLLNETFVSTKIVKTADKIMIKAFIKDGGEVVGAVLKQNKNIQIK